MQFLNELIEFSEQAGIGAPVWHGIAAHESELLSFAVAVHHASGRLAALWGTDERANKAGFRLHCVFGLEAGHAWISLDLSSENPVYPDLSGIFPAANRMQRATYDMVGIRSTSSDQRPWLRHGGWPADYFPLQTTAPITTNFTNIPTDYDFLQVGGEGAHEIPVGPIHAGIIEPGHFRFSVVGERVLRLEQRLGYQHKGTEQRLMGATIEQGAKLIGRISGDSTCAYAAAYANAVEAAYGIEPPPRALGLRALILERERIANHLGDLGMLGNDVAFGFGLTQFFKLKEDWVRQSALAFGHRFMMDCIVPGGVAANATADMLTLMKLHCDVVEKTVRELKTIYDEHAGLQDRFLTCGPISDALTQELSLTGIAARATGMLLDGRAWSQGYEPPVPYAGLGVRPASDMRGDVTARAAVRFGEIFESLRLLRKLIAGMPGGLLRTKLPAPLVGEGQGERGSNLRKGLGVVEGWRGEILVAVQLDSEGKLTRVHPHDPSWQLWPALEHAVLKDIVPDFPVINKSFNLSYSGADL
ncbi:MAG: NADH-quinone oxidoreductase subunit C [Rhodocyclaceae bacterium]|nr:NADH-quinone oxidoreductase subunit C [Rhodocyclaceae bacterium]